LVVDGERRVVLGELKDLSEILGKVGNDGVGDLGNVEESVAVCQLQEYMQQHSHLHQIDRPVIGNGGLGKVPSVHAELSIVESVGVG
jgi:hypothetical protein